MQDKTELDYIQNIIHGRAAEEVQKRDMGEGGVTHRALTRYFTALAVARQEMATTFAENELWLLVDACNNRDPINTVEYLPEAIRDSFVFEYLDTKWDVDGVKLVEKLNSLSFIQRAALVDAIELWWAMEWKDEPREIGDLLA